MPKNDSLSPAVLDLLTKAASNVQRLEGHFPEHRGNADALINNPDLKEFWKQAAALVRPGLAEDFITGLLEIMAMKGGYMPPETMAEKKERRSRFGQRVKTLRLALEDDPILADLSLAELMDMTRNEHIAKVLAFKEPRHDERIRDPIVPVTVRHVLDEFAPTFLEVLAALEAALTEFRPLNEWDRTKEQLDPLMPPPGRKDRQQARTERLLCRHCVKYTGDVQAELVVKALEGVFNEEVDSRDLTWRWAQMVRRHRR